MTYLYKLLFLICTLCLFACSNEEEFGDGMGYLSLSVSGSNETVTKALPEGYTGKQLAVEIVNSNNVAVEKTDDWTTWQGKQIGLIPGEYTIKAYSYGFDGKTSHMGAPYYYGAKTVTIESGKTLNETVTCKLANVKVSVKISDDIREKFKTFSVSVKAKDGSCDALTFDIDLMNSAIADTAYFPATDLVASYSATNMSDKMNSAERELGSAKGNDHYILNFTLAANGSGNVTVEVDESMRQYTYTFVLSQTSSNSAIITPNAWAKFAYVTATATTASGVTLDPEKMVFQYKPTTETDWANAKSVKATQDSENATTYKATLPDLDPATSYQCRLTDGTNNFVSSATQFTTEENSSLPNGNFNDWYQEGGTTWYAIAQTDATSFDSKDMLFSFWDSGNPGTSSFKKINPTQPEETEVMTTGGKSAILKSQFVGMFGLGKFAAGNIYTGHFCSANTSTYQAKIYFGQPFTSRPTQLKGWFKYNRGTDVDYPKDGGEYKTLLQQVGGDLCGIYIALVDNEGFDFEGHRYAYEINGDLSGDDPAHFKYKNAIDFSENNKNVIAYGTISEEEAKGTGEWQEFTIDLKYRDITRIPKYIIVVASASKYGDYFTGSTKSVMYIDDFELIYGNEPVLSE